MKKFLKYFGAILIVSCIFGFSSNTAYADEGKSGTNISISPVSNTIALSANSVYDASFKVTNSGSNEMRFEVYAKPYSYTYSESDDKYQLGFANETNYTQITRWITFKDSNGNYVENPTFIAVPGETVEIAYRITTPASIPDGGQYAVLFAHTTSTSTNASGIKTEASPGLIIYGRSKDGVTIKTSEISNLEIHSSSVDKTTKETKSHINGTAKVKNTGNTDVTAKGTLTVKGIFGQEYYKSEGTDGAISVIPETELTVSDEWENTPLMGLFNVTWKVVAGDKVEEISQVVLIMPIFVIIIMLILLTTITIWIIIGVKKRKERRSRFTV